MRRKPRPPGVELKRRFDRRTLCHFSLPIKSSRMMFRNADPAMRELVTGCIPAFLVLVAVAAGVITGLWWWLSH
jgi:hypothetical protein